MKVNFDHQFVDENKKNIRFGTKQVSVFKDLAVSCLLHAASGDGEPDAKEKRHRFDLAVKIKNFGSNAEINEKDADLINRCMGKAYHTLIAGPASYLLEGKQVPEFVYDPEPKAELKEAEPQ